MQSIKDLQDRLVDIRFQIQKVNMANDITVLDTTKSITDWLTWRREVAPNIQEFYNNLARSINSVRQQAIKQGVTMSNSDQGFSLDYIININEKELSEKIESIENILGILDGQLSLKNATIFIDL
jgi:hypothetical protein